MVLCIFLCNF